MIEIPTKTKKGSDFSLPLNMAEDMGLENEIIKFHECSQMFTNVHFSTVSSLLFAEAVS